MDPKKYELTEETKDFYGIKLFRIRRTSTGELGGFVAAEKNLDQSGNAWVSGDARVYGNAQVSGNARVRGDAWETTPLYIAGMKHSLSNSRHGHILIGCHEHTFAYWLDHYKAIGRAEGYSEEEIKQYGLFIELFVRVGK